MIKIAEIIQGYREGKVDSSTLVKMAAFREELEKNAGFWNVISNTLKGPAGQWMLAGAGVSTAAAAIHEGIKALENKYDDYKLSQEKMPAFKAMLDMHPTLKENESRAKLYFDALWHFDPHYAQEPLSAGAYIRQALNMDHVAGGPLPEMVDKTVQIAKAYNDANKSGKDEGTLGTIFTPIKTLGVDVAKTYTSPGLEETAFQNIPGPVGPFKMDKDNKPIIPYSYRDRYKSGKS